MTIDAGTRMTYVREIRKMAGRLRQEASAERITWAYAAEQAQETRNLIMQVVRTRSTPVGRAMAQRLKATGCSLNDLIARQAKHAHGPQVVFSTLSQSQKNKIYAAIVTSAGKSNPAVTRANVAFIVCRQERAISLGGFVRI